MCEISKLREREITYAPVKGTGDGEDKGRKEFHINSLHFVIFQVYITCMYVEWEEESSLILPRMYILLTYLGLELILLLYHNVHQLN